MSKRLGKWLFNGILVLLIVTGMLLVFSVPIKGKIVESNIQKSYDTFAQLSSEELKINDAKPVKKEDFDWGSVQLVSDADLQTITQTQRHDYYPTGFISIPDVGLKLPILKGLSQTNLLTGAGTLSPTQEMGKGNYGLASHLMPSEILFTPLKRVQMGMSIYISDKVHTYEYTVTVKEVVAPNRGDVMNEIEGKELITLVTCSDLAGTNRLIVQGELIAVHVYETADGTF